jgi:hypothetical protein
MVLPTSALRIETLRELIAAGSVRSVKLLGQRSGFTVLVRVGMQERFLANRAGVARVYAKLDTAAKDLRKMGLGEFAVNVVNFEAGRLRSARPDRAASMKRTQEALAHDAWFRAEVAQALVEADDPSTVWVSNEEAKAQSAVHRAQWLAHE